MLNEVVSLVSVTALLLGSPGPAPLALAAIGATVGVKLGLRFLAGILLGLLVASIGSAVALSLILVINPVAKQTVQFIGAAYIVYIAYKVASGPVLQQSAGSAEANPGFIDGFILNLLNPKAYAAFFALFSQFALTADTQFLSLLYTGVIAFLVAVIVDFLWLVLGGVIRPLFQQPRSARIMRVCFGVMMVVAVLSAFII